MKTQSHSKIYIIPDSYTALTILMNFCRDSHSQLPVWEGVCVDAFCVARASCYYDRELLSHPSWMGFFVSTRIFLFHSSGLFFMYKTIGLSFALISQLE